MASIYTEEEIRLMDWVRHVAGAWAGAGSYITNTIEYELSRFVRERNYASIIEYKESKEEQKVVRKARNFRRSSVKNQKFRKYRKRRRRRTERKKFRKIRK